MEDENPVNVDVKSAKKLFERDKQAHSSVYNAALDDLRFQGDDDSAQWNDEDYNGRVTSGRPALTLDKLGQFTRQVANQIRMNTPTISVFQSDGAPDDDTANILKGLIKNIEYVSSADDAYDTAVLSAIRCSIGFIRVDHDYTDDDSFTQDLKIDRVVNPLSCWLDSDSIKADGSDAKHGFIAEQMKVSEFKRKYKGKEPVSFETGKKEGGDLEEGDYITIVEFFKIDEKECEICDYGDGVGIPRNDEMGEPAQTRTVQKRTVKRYKMSGADILEETTFPGEYIPLVPVYGEEMWIEGRRNLFSLIRKAKTAQQMHNYWKSLETELLQKQPQAPIMAAEGQTEDYAEDWLNPGKTMVLRYKQTDLEGNPAPMPQRLIPPQTPTGVFQASLTTVDDIKSAMGMYGSSIGQQTNETSGIAIQRRKQEGEVGTYHFGDNLVKAITHVGRILVSAIPEIYDTPRIINIVGAEDEDTKVGINGEVVDEKQENHYDLTQGKYNVRVATGASFTTMRQESADFMSQIVQSQPEIMQIAGDIVFKNMDIPGAEALAERIKKTIPPELLGEDGEGGEADQDPEKAQLMQQLQEAVSNIQAMQQQVAQMEEQLKSKQGELQIKAQSEQSKAEYDRMKLELEAMKLDLDKQESEFDAGIKEQEMALKAEELELKKLEVLGKLAGEQEPQLIPEMESPDNYVGEMGDHIL